MTNSVDPSERDVPYFRCLLKTETERLTSLCDNWNTVLDTTADLTDDSEYFMHVYVTL